MRWLYGPFGFQNGFDEYVCTFWIWPYWEKGVVLADTVKMPQNVANMAQNKVL